MRQTKSRSGSQTINHTPLKGLVAAPFTPFRADGSLNLPVIDRQVQYLVKSGVAGAFICGTTGEGLSLTIEERKLVAERWCKAADSRLRVIVHVGDTGLEDCRELARHAQKIGADAIACQAPCFFKPASMADLVEFCAGVANEAPKVPFYYYHMPAMTGVNFAMADFLPAAVKRMPTLVGVKFTHENLMDFLQCLHLDVGRFDMVFGRDEALLGSLATGSRAAIGSTYNFAAPIYHRLIAAFEKNDLETARLEQLRSTQMITLLASYGFMGAAKATMKMLGVDVGPSRLPNKTLSKEQVNNLEQDLNKLGFFDWVKSRT